MSRIPNWMNTQMIAHRGFFDNSAPENSLAAFQKAIDRQFAIELDVQVMADGTLIVFHDWNFMRMTGFTGKVNETTYDQIKQLTLLETREHIPTFAEVLSLVDGQVPLMVELKNESRNHDLEKKAYALLKGYKGPYIIQSFNPSSVNWFRKHAGEVVRGQLSCRHETTEMKFITRWLMRNVWTNIVTRPDFVIYDIKALDAWIIKWLKWRRKPLFGYTAKSKEAYLQARAAGILAVFEQFDPRDL